MQCDEDDWDDWALLASTNLMNLFVIPRADTVWAGGEPCEVSKILNLLFVDTVAKATKIAV